MRTLIPPLAALVLIALTIANYVEHAAIDGQLVAALLALAVGKHGAEFARSVAQLLATTTNPEGKTDDTPR